MAIRLEDLPPAYQAQAMRQFAEQQQKRRGPPPSPAAGGPQKENKYHNTPTERAAASKVIHFPSQKEARRYDHLITLARAGQISDLRLQVDFTLQEAYTDQEGRRVRAIRYKADFTYRTQDGRLVVEDVKSRPTRTKEYLLKRKLLKDRFGIEITEV